jgi:DNA-binding IclR family transcriptional regulator
MQRRDTDKLLDTLRDGRWHKTEELQQAAGLDARKTRLILAFMNEFKLTETDKKTNKVRLSRLTKQFLEKLNDTDPTKSYEEITA